MWIIISVLLGLTSLYLLISNCVKNDQIAALKYTIIQLSNTEIDKAMKEWERFKG
ncbi:hypothetical protein NGH43_06115 [Staphylococcus saprophyticus]|uniref:hypothetical protein n=1 Tax=Staphylococcus saprophyticus TaxID=29385 RepID=UPI002DBB8227|nr:hypothetical protein [Staphylococcus saprophyticus]MEB8089534.1 hypothetical protein [Staphylococcus saprophyticus]